MADEGLRDWAAAIGGSASVAQRALYGAQFSTRARGRRGGTALTQAEVAARLGVSDRAIRKAVRVLRSSAPELIEAVRKGDMPLDLADRYADERSSTHPVIEQIEQAALAAIAALPRCCARAKFTYVVGVGDRVKIGHGGDVPRRLHDLQCMNAYALELLAVARGRGLEDALHARFADDRLHGEWFVAERARPWIVSVVEVARRRRVCVHCAALDSL